MENSERKFFFIYLPIYNNNYSTQKNRVTLFVNAYISIAQHNFFYMLLFEHKFFIPYDFAMQRLSIERMDYSKQMRLAIFMHNVNNFDLI